MRQTTTPHSLLWLAVLSLAGIVSTAPAFAQTTRNFVPTSGDWDTAANWNSSGVPGTLDTAIVTSRTAIKTAGNIAIANLFLRNAATLEFTGVGSTLSVGTVTFDNTGLNTSASSLLLDDTVIGGSDLVISSGTTLIGRIATIGRLSTNANTTIIQNNGTITNNVSGNTMTLNSSSFINTSLIQATSGANLSLRLTNGMTNTGTISIVGGGSLLIAGGAGIINTGGTVSVTNSTFASNNTNNYIRGGTTTLNTATINNNNAQFRSGATVNGTRLDLNNGSTLRFGQFNNTLSTTTINFVNSGGSTVASDLRLADNTAFAGSSLTISSGTTLIGNIGVIGRDNVNNEITSLVNDGTITSNFSGNTTTFSTTNLTNNGAISATGGASLSFATDNAVINSGTIGVSGGMLSVAGGGMTNSGTVTVANSSLVGTAYINGGTTTLNTATVSNTTAEFRNGATINGSQLTLNNGATLRVAEFGNTLSTTAVNFTNTGGNTVASNIRLADDTSYAGSNLTIANGTTLSGNIGVIGRDFVNSEVTTVTNNGTITSNVSGNTTTFNTTNLSNTGTLQTTNGAAFDFATANRPTNTGTIIASNGTTQRFRNGLTQTAGSLQVNGTVSVDSGQQIVLQGGTLSGTGTINGEVRNNGGTITPGNSVGTLSLSSLILDTGAVLQMELDTTSNSDLIDVAGAFNFATGASTPFIVGFSDAGSLATGQAYKLVRYGSTNFAADVLTLNGQFQEQARGNLSSISGDFSLVSDGTGKYLAFTPSTFQPVPVSPMWVTLPTGFVTMFLTGRKRRKK